MSMSITECRSGVVLNESQLGDWADADQEQVLDWLDAGEGDLAIAFAIGEGLGFSFVRDEPMPTRPYLVYAEGTQVAVVISGDDEETLRAAVEEPDDSVELADDFLVEGPLVLFDGDATVRPGGALAKRFSGPWVQLPLNRGEYFVDLHWVGTVGSSAYAAVLMFTSVDEVAEP